MSTLIEPAEISGLDRYLGIVFEKLDPEKMRLLRKEDPKEWERLVIGKCNLIEWPSWRNRGYNHDEGLNPRWHELDKEFKECNIKHEYTQPPGEDFNIAEAVT